MRGLGRRVNLVAGGVAALVLAGGGGAIAATELDGPSSADNAIISDAASQLGVSSSALSSALRKAITDEINSEVSAGKLTEEQASALESRLSSGKAPLFGGLLGGFRPRGFGGGLGRGGFGPGGLGGGFGGELSTAASYLGLTDAQIKADERGGKTLAEIAVAQGKTADGLVAALVSAQKSKLAGAVSAGKVSTSQEQAIESHLQQQITDLVNGTAPKGFGGGFGPGSFGGGVGRGAFGPGGFGGGLGRGGFGFGGLGGGFRGERSAAASYLGLTEAQIRSEEQGGKTLAEIAFAQGKTADGLVAALVSAQKSKLASAVSAGKLSPSQAQAIESHLQQQITDLVNGTAPKGFGGGFGRGGSGGVPRGGNGPGSGSAPESFHGGRELFGEAGH